MRYWLMALCLLSGPPVTAGGYEPGTSSLGIMVDGSRMNIHLEGPVGNFGGLDRQPVTPEQSAQLAGILDALRAGNNLFLTPPEADCRMVSAAVSPPAYGDERTPGNATLTASWQFRCSSPTALIWVDARVLAGFPATKKLVTAVATPEGKKGLVLTPGTPRVLLPRRAATR